MFSWRVILMGLKLGSFAQQNINNLPAVPALLCYTAI
jgi:hypothetical protein